MADASGSFRPRRCRLLSCHHLSVSDSTSPKDTSPMHRVVKIRYLRPRAKDLKAKVPGSRCPSPRQCDLFQNDRLP
jgi:hypothetical protein